MGHERDIFPTKYNIAENLDAYKIEEVQLSCRIGKRSFLEK
jgi:hypothetical protein